MEHVGDDFPDEIPDDLSDDGGAGDLPHTDVPGVGDGWHDATPGLDGDGDDDGGWVADGDVTPATAETIDLDFGADDGDDDAPGIGDAFDDVPTADDDSSDVPVVGDDSPVGIGADPDVPAGDTGDGDWLDLPDLANVDVPEPAGGPPWVDTGLLGDSDDAPAGDLPGTGDDLPATPEGGADDLRAALGEPASVGDPTDAAYQDLATSDDPAVRNLARLWGPPA